MFTLETMLVRFGKTREKSPFSAFDDVSRSQCVLTPSRVEMLTETEGRSVEMPAYMEPQPESTSMPGRTALRRPRESVRLVASMDAENGVAAIVELELEMTVNKGLFEVGGSSRTYKPCCVEFVRLSISIFIDEPSGI
jgi:hypothetical protein